MSQAVILYLRLSDNGFGSSEDREELSRLQDHLIDSIQAADVGELDGDLVGEGECIFYMYGKDADRLFATIEPVIKSFPVAVSGYAIKRYSDMDNVHPIQTRVTW